MWSGSLPELEIDVGRRGRGDRVVRRPRGRRRCRPHRPRRRPRRDRTRGARRGRACRRPESAGPPTSRRSPPVSTFTWRRDRLERAPERVHPVAVQPRGAGQQFRRVDHVRRAALVHVDPDVRHAGQDSARGAGVIEVDVRQQDLPHLASAHRGRPAPLRGRAGTTSGRDRRASAHRPRRTAAAITLAPWNWRSMMSRRQSWKLSVLSRETYRPLAAGTKTWHSPSSPP